MGLFLIAFGVWEFTVTQQAERRHQLRHHRGGLVTPAQGYAAAVGFAVLGAFTVALAVVDGRSSSDETRDPPQSI